jgi:hypothetical protein
MTYLGTWSEIIFGEHMLQNVAKRISNVNQKKKKKRIVSVFRQSVKDNGCDS